MFILEVISLSLSLFVIISNFIIVLVFIIIIILTYPDIDLLGFDFLNRAANLLSILKKGSPDLYSFRHISLDSSEFCLMCQIVPAPRARQQNSF